MDRPIALSTAPACWIEQVPFAKETSIAGLPDLRAALR